MKKKKTPIIQCEQFCNVHCSFDCPNVLIEAFEDRFDIPASDAGYYRIKCSDCCYYDKYCTCSDCYFMGSDDCLMKAGGC